MNINRTHTHHGGMLQITVHLIMEVVKRLVIVMMMSSLANLGQCLTNRDNGVHVYAPKPAVMNEEFLMICETIKEVTGIRWRKNGGSIAFVYTDTCNVGVNSENYRYSCKDGQFNLTIPKSQMTDELHGSVWTCVNPYGGMSNEFSLYVNIPVKTVTFKRQQKILKLKEGDLGELECLTGPCRPPANVSFQYEYETITTGWMMHEQERDEGADTYITRSVWKFQASRSQNGKTLTCKAINGWNIGYFAQFIKMEIMYGPGSVGHSVPSSNLTIPEHGSTSAVTCSSDCNPVCHFSWWNNGAKASDGSTLILTNVSRTQAGTYVCNASNVFGSGSTELKLEVTYPPTITELQAKANPVMENNSLDLVCKADSFPPSKVTLLKSNITLSSATINSYHHIKHAQCWDTGTYTCTASNRLGEPVSMEIDIIVKCKPRLDPRIKMQQKTETKYITAGSYLRIKYHFIAYPTPKVSWCFHRSDPRLESPLSKDNVDMFEENNLFMHTYRLFIPPVSDEDFGYYTIHVENQYGRSSAQVFVVKETRYFELTSWKKYVIIGSSGGVGLFILVMIVVCCLRKKMARREEDILGQIQAFEMQQWESVYQNKGRLLELTAAESYDDLKEDDPIYNASKYGSMKDKKEEDEIDDDCSSYESESPSICETDAGYCVPKLVTDGSKDDGNVTGIENQEDRQANKNQAADTAEYSEIIDIIKDEDDSFEVKRQSSRIVYIPEGNKQPARFDESSEEIRQSARINDDSHKKRQLARLNDDSDEKRQSARLDDDSDEKRQSTRFDDSYENKRQSARFDDSSEDKRQSASSDDYDDTDVCISKNNEEMKVATE